MKAVRGHLLGDNPVGDIGWYVIGHANGHDPREIRQGISHGGGDAAVIADEAAAFVSAGIQVIDAVKAGTKPVLVAFQIDFAEVRSRPPMVMMSNPDVPDEINQMVVQVTKSFQGILPPAGSHYEQRKLTLILTGEELESFNMKPYPNQVYELKITESNLSFKET